MSSKEINAYLLPKPTKLPKSTPLLQITSEPTDIPDIYDLNGDDINDPELKELFSTSGAEEEEITKENIYAHIGVNIFSCSFGLLCFSFLETLNLIFMGYTKESEVNMASIGLGNIFLNFFGVLLGFGAIGGLDTMGSYCYGKRNHRLLGIYTIRTRINLFLLFICICVPFSYISKTIIQLINDTPEISNKSSVYIWNMLPAVIMTFNYNLNIRYLQVMQVYFAPTIIIFFGILFHYFACYLFVIVLEFDVKGICLATFLSMTLLFIATSFYIRFKKRCKYSRFLYDSRVFDYAEFYDYFMLCIYSGIQHYGDYIGYEVITVFGALLNVESFIATILVLNFTNLVGYIYVGCAYPLSHFVGYFLGRNNFKMYHFVINEFFKLFFIQSVIFGFVIIVFNKEISALYTPNQEIIELAGILFKIWGIGVVFDIYNMMFQGILRGAGKQKVVSIWNLAKCFLWMIPFSYVLCFTFDFGVVGLYIGCMSVVAFLCFVNWFYYATLDLDEVVKFLSSHSEEKEIERRLSNTDITNLIKK